MIDFNEFVLFLQSNADTVLYDAFSELSNVSENQRTISKEEWKLIEKSIVNCNLAILRQYHKWLEKELP